MTLSAPRLKRIPREATRLDPADDHNCRPYPSVASRNCAGWLHGSPRLMEGSGQIATSAELSTAACVACDERNAAVGNSGHTVDLPLCGPRQCCAKSVDDCDHRGSSLRFGQRVPLPKLPWSRQCRAQ